MNRFNISFFGSSLVSAWRNGAAGYYRGLIHALHERGHRITFYEPDACERQQHRDIPDPEWARVVVYDPTDEAVLDALDRASESDLIVKCSGVGVFDELLEAAVLELKMPETRVAFLDAEAPATLERIQSDPEDSFASLIPEYDFILTRGGGKPVVDAYVSAGAQECIPIYNALDPHTHFPVPPEPRFEGTLGFLGNRTPDCEARIEEFFLNPAARLPDQKFLLGGSDWKDKRLPQNVSYIGPISVRDHNAFNGTSLAVLNIGPNSMARFGFSPPPRIFEAAGAGACLITDAGEGIEMFLEPDREVIVARNGDDVARILRELTPERARSIGAAALDRVRAEHTCAHRANQLETVLNEKLQEIGA